MRRSTLQGRHEVPSDTRPSRFGIFDKCCGSVCRTCLVDSTCLRLLSFCSAEGQLARVRASLKSVAG